jgi:hypothetical protein
MNLQGVSQARAGRAEAGQVKLRELQYSLLRKNETH